MSILDTIEKVQAKPEHTRRQIMYVVLGLCMAVVFAIWAVNFSYTLNNGSNSQPATSMSPIDYIKNVINNLQNGGQK
ncbi:MAG: hypothetical protein WC764_00850 [Candidatus Paceibacterota bacterium]|jgi:hypothetical protein